MEIKYDLTQNYLKLYNEANGVIFCKKRLIKNNNIKVRPYMQYIIIYTLTLIAIAFMYFIFGNKLELDIFKKIYYIFLKFAILFFFVATVTFFIGEKSKINSKTGTIEINEEGIMDKSDKGHTTQFNYDAIEAVVITKHLIVIVTNIPIMIFFRNEEKEKVIETIKKYSNILILDKSKN